jgi:hypothetical protein
VISYNVKNRAYCETISTFIGIRSEYHAVGMHFYANGVPFFQAQCLFFGGMVSAVKICIGGGNLDLMKS